MNYLVIFKSIFGSKYSNLLLVLITASLLFFLPNFNVEAAKRNTTRIEIKPEKIVETPLGQGALRTFTSTRKPQITQPFILSIELETPSGYDILKDDVSGDYGDFELELSEDTESVLNNQGKKFVRSWSVFPVRTGQAQLPPIPISLKNLHGEPVPIIVQTEPLTFEVEGATSNVNVKAIQMDVTPIDEKHFLLFLLPVIIPLLAIIFYLYIKRKKGKSAFFATSDIQDNPFEKAQRCLVELENSRVYFENSQSFYTEISIILRRYLSERFALNAEEKTTQELLTLIDSFYFSPKTEQYLQLNNAEKDNKKNTDSLEITLNWEDLHAIGMSVLKDEEIRAKIANSLKSVDLVKFARQSTTFNDATQVLNQTKETISQAESLFNERIQQKKQELRVLLQKQDEKLTSTLHGNFSTANKNFQKK